MAMTAPIILFHAKGAFHAKQPEQLNGISYDYLRDHNQKSRLAGPRLPMLRITV